MKQGFSGWPCSIARATDVFGDAWTLLILRDCMHGVRRFDEFQKSLQIARNTLSDRLSRLVDAGVLAKQFYQDNPPRYEYLLTEMGGELFPVISAMLAWGDKWLDGGGELPCSSITKRAATPRNRKWCAATAENRSWRPKCNCALGRDSQRRSNAVRTSATGSPPFPGAKAAGHTHIAQRLEPPLPQRDAVG